MATRGPIPGSVGAFAGGRKADPERNAKLGRTSGRKSRSTAVAIVRTEVAALDELPPPPAHLTPEQRELWHGLVTTYAAAGVLSQLDHVNIVRVCQLHAERAMWLRIVTESPTVSVPVKSRQGDVIGEKVTVHPAVAALRACDRALDTITTQLCLSPAARARTGWLVAEIANTEAHTDSILERLARPQRDVIDVTGIAED